MRSGARSLILRNLTTRITQRDDFECDPYSNINSEESRPFCRILSLKRTHTSISKQTIPEKDPVKRLEQKVWEMEQGLAKKEKFLARRLNKLKRKLKGEEDTRKQLTNEMKSLALELHRQTEIMSILTKGTQM